MGGGIRSEMRMNMSMVMSMLTTTQDPPWGYFVAEIGAIGRIVSHFHCCIGEIIA